MADQKPHRVQLKRTKGWRMPENTVKVARPSKWGNPFTVEQYGSSAEAKRHFEFRLLERKSHPESRLGKIQSDIEQLRGKNLACFCRLDQPCHADVLLELANPDQPQ